jgi:hypothetical protein
VVTIEYAVWYNQFDIKNRVEPNVYHFVGEMNLYSFLTKQIDYTEFTISNRNITEGMAVD